MIALTLTQPWATLVAIGAKRIETRCWSTAYRGPIAIHAAKGFPVGARETCFDHPFHLVLASAGIHGPSHLPLGSIVAVCELADIWRTKDLTSSEFFNTGVTAEYEYDFGDYSAGRFAFSLRDVRPLATPIPARGMLGLWELSPELLAAIAEQTDEDHAR